MMRAFLTAWIAIAACSAQLTKPPFSPETSKLERADLSEALDLLCPGQGYLGAESGCRVCPASSKRAGIRTDAAITAAIRGHFLKPDSDDLLLDFNACGPALLTHSSSGWFVDRSEALPDGPCRKIPDQKGRDGLLCYQAASTADRENARLTFSFLPDRETELAAALDNTGGACDSLKRVVVQSGIQDVKLTPGAGGRSILVITARCRRGPLSARSQKACARGPGFEDIGPLAPFRTFRLDYRFDGDSFSLAPTAKPVKQAYDACVASPQ